MTLFVHSLVEFLSDRMYLICFIIVIMVGFDDDDFSLSGLNQQGHELDVTVISSSDDDNYGGLLECVQKLGEGEISDKTSSMEGGVQAGVKPCDEPCVEPNASNFPISKIINTEPITPNSMASSISQSDKSIHVIFIHFNGLQVRQI